MGALDLIIMVAWWCGAVACLFTIFISVCSKTRKRKSEKRRAALRQQRVREVAPRTCTPLSSSSYSEASVSSPMSPEDAQRQEQLNRIQTLEIAKRLFTNEATLAQQKASKAAENNDAERDSASIVEVSARGTDAPTSKRPGENSPPETPLRTNSNRSDKSATRNKRPLSAEQVEPVEKRPTIKSREDDQSISVKATQRSARSVRGSKDSSTKVKKGSQEIMSRNEMELTRPENNLDDDQSISVNATQRSGRSFRGSKDSAEVERGSREIIGSEEKSAQLIDSREKIDNRETVDSRESMKSKEQIGSGKSRESFNSKEPVEGGKSREVVASKEKITSKESAEVGKSKESIETVGKSKERVEDQKEKHTPLLCA